MKESRQEERERPQQSGAHLGSCTWEVRAGRAGMKGHPESPEKLRPTWGYVDPALKKEEGEEERRTNRDGVKSEELEPVFRRPMRGFSLNCRTRPFQRVGLALVFQRSSLPIELLLSIR